jgi:hypothetical protein
MLRFEANPAPELPRDLPIESNPSSAALGSLIEQPYPSDEGFFTI